MRQWQSWGGGGGGGGLKCMQTLTRGVEGELLVIFWLITFLFQIFRQAYTLTLI